jgi:small ligand-binding sensory domain FIST
MDDREPAARAAVAEDVDWERAVHRVLAQTRGIVPDLAILFASAAYAEHFPDLARLDDNAPIAAVLCTCNGRGVGMFGVRDHDAATIAERLGPLPLAGLF